MKREAPLTELIKYHRETGDNFLLIVKTSEGLFRMTNTDSKLLNLLDASNPESKLLAPRIGKY